MSERRRIRSDRGAVLVFVAILLPVLLGMAALAIDLGVLYLATAQAQNTADAAALAAVGKLRENMSFDAAAMSAAQQEAIAVAAANKIMNTPVTLSSSNVQVGAWDSNTKTLVAWSETATNVAAQVTVSRTDVPTFFARVMGKQFMTASRTAVAGLSIDARGARHSKSLMIVQDASSSFSGSWVAAIAADTELLRLINANSIVGDAAGMITFTSALSQGYVNDALNGLTAPVGDPLWNTGIKYTTNSSDHYVRTNPDGTTTGSGPKAIRPMIAPITAYDPNNRSVLPAALVTASSLVTNGRAWGDTDTGFGLNYAIDRLLERGSPSTTDMVIVLVSDGMPHTVGQRPDGKTTARLRQDALDAGCRARNSGIRLHTVTTEGTGGANYAFNESLRCGGDGSALRGAADGSDLLAMLNLVGAIELGNSVLVK